MQHPQRRARPVARRRARHRLHRRATSPTGARSYDVVLDNVGNQPLRRLRRALTPTGTLVYNAGGSPDGHLFGPIGAILRVVAVNGFVRQRLRPLPTTGRGSTCSPSPSSSRTGRSPRSSAGPSPSPTRLRACATSSRDTPAARSSITVRVSRPTRLVPPQLPAWSARPMITVTALTKQYGNRLAVDDLTFEVAAGRVTGLRRPERRREVDHHADDGRAHPARPRRRPLRRRPLPGPAGPGPHRRRGARRPVHAPGPHGPEPPAGHRRPQRHPVPPGRRGPGRGRARVGRRTSGPAGSPSACASAWPWRRRCWATRRCCCSTSRPTASTRTASAGCATTSSDFAAPRRHGLRVQPPHQRAQHVRRRPRRRRRRPAAGRRVRRGDHRPQRRRRRRRDPAAGRASKRCSPRTASPSRARPTGWSSAGPPGHVVSQIAFDNGIRLLELTETSRSLEDSLLDMTRASAEFASAMTPARSHPCTRGPDHDHHRCHPDQPRRPEQRPPATRSPATTPGPSLAALRSEWIKALHRAGQRSDPRRSPSSAAWLVSWAVADVRHRRGLVVAEVGFFWTVRDRRCSPPSAGSCCSAPRSSTAPWRPRSPRGRRAGSSRWPRR